MLLNTSCMKFQEWKSTLVLRSHLGLKDIFRMRILSKCFSHAASGWLGVLLGGSLTDIIASNVECFAKAVDSSLNCSAHMVVAVFQREPYTTYLSLTIPRLFNCLRSPTLEHPLSIFLFCFLRSL